jgi:hypothetical protein
MLIRVRSSSWKVTLGVPVPDDPYLKLRKFYEDSMLLISSITSTSHLVFGLGIDRLLIIIVNCPLCRESQGQLYCRLDCRCMRSHMTEGISIFFSPIVKRWGGFPALCEGA